MATRAIVTSQPEVACDICARRLLRGEQPDTFVADGRPTVVCELCTPRARSAGWVRASEAAVVGKRPEDGEGHSGALRGLMRRWRGSGRERRAPGGWGEVDGLQAASSGPPPNDDFGADPLASEEEMWAFEDAALGSAATGAEAAAADRPADDGAVGAAARGNPATAPEPGSASAHAAPVPARRERATGASAAPLGAPGGRAPADEAHAPGDDALLVEAVTFFNATDGPQRIAGVARSLGAPVVTVRRIPSGSPDSSSAAAPAVAIVAAWELCWYRWNVDLSGVAIDAPLVAQGAELDELPAEDLAGNAAVDKRGSVRLP